MPSLRWLAVIVPALAAVAQAQTSAARPPVPGAPAGVTAVVGVNVVPMDTERVLPDQTVLVQTGWITALGPVSKVKVPDGAVRIDGRGKYLIPGLADMHVHLGADSASIQRKMLLYLSLGVTTLRNMNHLYRPSVNGQGVLQIKALAAAGTLLSPRVYTSGSWAGRDVRKFAVPPESVATLVAAYKASGYDHIKPYFETGALFDSLVAAARRERVPLAGHVPGLGPGLTPSLTGQEVTLERVLESGAYRSIEHLRGYYHRLQGGSINDTIQAMVEATKRAGVWNTTTLTVNEDTTWRRGRLVKALHDAGAGLLLGTDAVGTPNLVAELQASMRAGLTPYQALLTGTRNVAQYFGTLEETGTVSLGKRADLVLLYGNPLENICTIAEPAGVMIGGRWLPREEFDRGPGNTPASSATRSGCSP